MEATMRLDQGSLIFTPQNGECPSWETALGQSREPRDDMPPYYFKAEGYENMLKGMYFNSVPLAKTSCILGKKKLFVTASESYLNPEYQEIQLASKFDNVIVHFQNNAKIFRNTPIILLLTKIQDVNKSHYRRRSIKYSPHTTYDTIKNQESLEEIQRHYQERLMCYGFFIEHFDTLHLYCVSVDDNSYTYSNLSLPQTEWTDWADWELKEREKIQNETPIISSEKDNQEKGNNVSFTPSQIIYYGVPACGKSNKIREQLKDVPEKNKVRVVFHPEYTNAEFIGQILPKVNGHVTYEFTPGPFTQIIKRAYLNPNEQFYLVIEEINRGNAAAIFGDTFQLLDRLKAGETDSLGNDPANAAVNTFTEGWSQYFVQNDDVNAYIRKTTVLDDGSYQERNDGEPIEEIKIKEIHFNANTAIRLPPNLSILATMNTSDQNVFTLDNAFQRRFDMELVRNEFELATKDVDKSKYGGFKTADIQTQHDAKIADTDVKWGDFWEWINTKIVSTLKGLSSTEDKRLGVWFVSNIDGKIEEKIFAEKVLKYLWDDVFKFKRPQVFASEIDTLENLIAAFGKSRFAVFKEAFNSSSSIAESSQNEGAANQ
jgi:hypothetical protein